MFRSFAAIGRHLRFLRSLLFKVRVRRDALTESSGRKAGTEGNKGTIATTELASVVQRLTATLPNAPRVAIPNKKFRVRYRRSADSFVSCVPFCSKLLFAASDSPGVPVKELEQRATKG